MNSTKKRFGTVNKLKFKNLKYRLRRITFAIALAGTVGKQVTNAITSQTDEYVVPNNCIEMNIEVSVDENTKVETIAKKYYIEDIYPDFKEYCNMIKKENDVNFGVVTPYQNIKVPVIVREDNIYLNNIKSLESELETLPIWVDYTIQNGDSIYSLAYLGAKDSTEAIDLVDRIYNYNNKIKNKNELYCGDTISIINPKIGEIRKKIYSLEESLKSSLIVNENQKQK